MHIEYEEKNASTFILQLLKITVEVAPN